MKKEIYKLISNAGQGLFALALTVFSGTAYSQTTFTYNYTGAVQLINLPGTYSIECWGANGGDNLAPQTGGVGGYSRGTFNVVSAPYYIYVGGKGTTLQTANTAAIGGYNGGGNSGAYSSTSLPGGSGGGATHVASAAGLLSTLSTNQSAVVIVAGGGGGSGSNNGGSNLINKGAHAGGLIGGNGLSGTYGGFGGSQVAGGSNASVPLYSGTMAEGGSFGKGGSAELAPSGYAAYPSNTGGGGGAGWYGGAAALWEGGGGGSGYIGGVSSGTTIMFGQPGYVNNPNPTGNGYVLLTRLCDVNVTASKNPICVGESITLTTNAGSNIQWNTGASTSTITVSPTSTTEYTVSGVSSSSSACSSTVTVLVKVNPLPVLSLSSFPPVLCAGASGSVIGSGAVTYSWSNGTTGSATSVNPLISTVYTATGTNVHGCKSSETVMVNVSTNSLTVTQSTNICKGTSINLTASGVTSAMWNNGLAFLTISVTPSVTTAYSVSGVDALGCTLSNTVLINVNSLPSVTILPSKQTVCRGESVTLTASGANSYLWDNSDTSPTSTRTLNVNVPYQYSVTGTDANGCSSSAIITVVASACAGIQENGLNSVSVFPNPATKEITISMNGSGRKLITVTDLLGKVVLSEETTRTEYILNIENLPAGLFNLHVQEDELVTVKKFVKQ